MMTHGFYDGSQPGLAVATQYDPSLVFLSIAIACLASYAALNIAGRIGASEKIRSQQVWILAGAWSMGIGIWAMHFIGMLALKLPLSVSYDLLTTVLSTIPAILAGAIMMSVAVKSRQRRRSLLLFAGAGTLVGAGIGSMHYAGMMAMHGIGRELIMRFAPLLFGLSIIIAVVLANVALYIFFLIGSKKEDHHIWWIKIGAALVMGFAISGMHYTGMASTYFFLGEGKPDDGRMALSPTSLAIWVSLTSVSITLLAIAVTVIDRRLKKAADAEHSSRAQMLEAIESISDGFSLYDMNDRLAVCNQRYRELMDCGLGIVPGMSFEAIIRGAAESGSLLDAAGRIDEWMNERLARHRTPRSHFIEHWSGDRWFRVSERRVWNIGTVAIRTDITELKRTEMELSKAIEEAQRASANAEEASRAKSAFLANMSHELRTPMNAIIGYCEMLIEEVEDAGHQAYLPDLQKIHTAGKHLLSLINDILDLSKIEAGKMDLYVEEFDVPAIIEEIKNTIQPLIAKNANRLIVDCPTTLPRMQSDLTKLRQTLFNLLSNASKFAKEGQITLAVTTEHVEGGDWLNFRVADNGIGMSPEQIDKVFEAFTQADNSTTRKYGGTGLGLTITKKFCQMLGGDISVNSALGKGSTFTIRLPSRIAASKPMAAREPSSTVKSNKDHVADSGINTVLIIDDDIAVQEVLRETFEKAGFSVACAASGEEGLRLAKQLRPAAITLDILMPHMDGWGVLIRLKNDPITLDIPVVLVTIMDDKNLGYSLGAAEYLTKPVDRQRLVALVRKHQYGTTDCPILVVDDDAGNRDMMSRTLISAGYSVIEAEHGQAALTVLEQCNPRLIILDLMMPVMDGFQFMTKLREQEKWRTLPVIVVTAKELTEEDRMLLQGSVERVLPKGGFTREQLLQDITRQISTQIRTQDLIT